MTTIPFGPRGREQDPMLARAGELPKDVVPSRDLWPGIAARLDETRQEARPRSFGWPMALAAAVMVASVSALLTWGLMREPTPAPAEIAAATVPAAIMPVSYGANSPITPAELAARNDLLVQFRQRLDELSPQTRDAVVRNLAVIQQAADEIDAALAQDPASGLLNQLLRDAYRHELRLYSKVVTAGGDAMRRT